MWKATASKPPPTGIRCPGFVSESAPFASRSCNAPAISGNGDDPAGVGVLAVEPPPHVRAIRQRADRQRNTAPRSIFARVKAFGAEGMGDDLRLESGCLIRADAQRVGN